MYSLLRRQGEVCGEMREEMVKDEPRAKMITFRGLFFSKKTKKKENL